MHATICNITGLHYSDPIYYTKGYLNNEYVKANDLARHIHLYNHLISRIDYSNFYGLKGHIYKLEETEQEELYGSCRHSRAVKSIYTFNREMELLQLVKEESGVTECIRLVDSLKKPDLIQIDKSFDGALSSQTEIYLNAFMEYDKIEKHSFYNNAKSTRNRNEQRTARYIFNAGKDIQKIYLRNNGDEQSRTVIVYNPMFQILESKTFDQKDKSKLLYEAIFEYDDDDVLKKIIYKRYNPTKRFSGNWFQELNFEYNSKGFLERLSENHMTLSYTRSWIYDLNGNVVYSNQTDYYGNIEFEVKNRYKYDKYGNWTYKEVDRFRFEENRKLRISKSKIFRRIDYFQKSQKSSPSFMSRIITTFFNRPQRKIEPLP